MQLGEDGKLGHLTYCTNIHAAEHWEDVHRGLAGHLGPIKQSFSPDQPMGVGIRLAASAATSLTEAENMRALHALLGDDFYVFTVNGFPYGTFHGERVKDGAYRPDWTQKERLNYTNLLADHLAVLLPDGVDGSVSTVPGTYKPWLDANKDSAHAQIVTIADHLLQHAAHLVEIKRRTGKSIMLTLEPEPFCLLETAQEAVAFFERHLFSDAATTRLCSLAKLSSSDAQAALRSHLGVCYDVCHAAVEYEDPRESVAALRSAGVAIGKLQLSSALKVDTVDANAIAALRAFDEPVYLHQTMQERDGVITRYEDLSDAFAQSDSAQGAQWRSHFHVPVFLERMEHFATTQDFLREILAMHAAEPVSSHLEVETYTWDVLPKEYRHLGLADAIARELNWVKTELGCVPQVAAR